MSEIKKEVLLEKIKELVIKANTVLRPDVLDALKEAQEIEENPNGKKALTMLIENTDIAKKEGIPVCQDTGYVDIYFIWPASIALRNDLQDIADEAVKHAYSEKPFRKSIVADPLFERKNTNTNTPVNIKVFATKEEKLQIRVVVKGAGSDNSSVLFMLNPSISEDELKKIIIEHVREYAAKSCPPLVIGMGIGSSFDQVAHLSKKALFRKIKEANTDAKYAKLEENILKEVNNMGIGASGLGGKTTALSVMIEKAPSHMATLPLALSLNCYALRTASTYIQA